LPQGRRASSEATSTSPCHFVIPATTSFSLPHPFKSLASAGTLFYNQTPMKPATRRVNRLSGGIWLLLLLILLPGCYEMRQGHFEAEKVPGWTVRTSEGINTFYYPAKVRPEWKIVLRGCEEGNIYLHLVGYGDDPYAVYKWLSFSNQPIKIVFNDHIYEETIPAGDFHSPRGAVLDVSNTEDFTLILPSFKLRDSIIPELSVRLRWSDKKYRVWPPLQ
jgi:hypothetical protein